MRVVADGQPEMSFRALTRSDDGVLAGAEQLDDCQRQIGKTIRVGCASCAEEVVERARIGLRRERSANLTGDIDDAAPSFGSAEHAPHRG